MNYKAILFSCFSTLVTACNSSRNYSVPDPIKISGASVKVQADSKFMEQIQISSVSRAPGGERKLRTVGQMIAMANSSGELTKNTASWVTLDQSIVKSFQIHLSEDAAIGSAYGVTTIPSSYRGEIHAGERLEVYRYGLRQNSTIGIVIAIRPPQGSTPEDSVVFSISHGLDWYPGTNCEVEFPLIHHQAVTLSPLSMLHEGLREYVMKEVSPGEFTPQEVVVVNETNDQVYALGDLAPGDRIIERGAILLKPAVHQIITNSGIQQVKAPEEVRHVR
jgi:hypothetical protein